MTTEDAWKPLRLHERSLKTMCGEIVTKQVVAIAELVANGWDAGAKLVQISLPRTFPGIVTIEDDGQGMSEETFDRCWREIQFERRRKMQKPVVDGKPRNVFGRNGLGRFGVFAFANTATIESRHNGELIRWEAKWEHASGTLVSTRVLQRSATTKANGTIIEVEAESLEVTRDQLDKKLGGQFAAVPDFSVIINETAVNFKSLAESQETVMCGAGELGLRVYDDADEAGVAWWVSGRLVGEVSRKEYFDTRAKAAKKLLFVISADCLEEFVAPDWTSFKATPAYMDAHEQITNRVREIVNERRADAWEARKSRILKETERLVEKDGPNTRQLLLEFVEHVVKNCPNIRDHDILALAEFLVTMERSQSNYSLIHQLAKLDGDDVQKLDTILDTWMVAHVRQVLQQIQERIDALNALQTLVDDDSTLEVQQLQPAVMACLWVLGPEYESPEFTSNRSILTVLDKFGGDKWAVDKPRRRPDFVVSSSGDLISCRSRDAYDDRNEAHGLADVVIVELKRPSETITSRAIQQCREYVEELEKAGTVTASTTVRAFAIGRRVDPLLRQSREGNRTLSGMSFADFIRRGEKRLFGLREKLENTPYNGKTTMGEYLASTGGVNIPLDFGG